MEQKIDRSCKWSWVRKILFFVVIFFIIILFKSEIVKASTPEEFTSICNSYGFYTADKINNIKNFPVKIIFKHLSVNNYMLFGSYDTPLISNSSYNSKASFLYEFYGRYSTGSGMRTADYNEKQHVIKEEWQLLYSDVDLYLNTGELLYSNNPNQGDYLIYAPLKDLNGNSIEDMNFRFIYRLSNSSQYFLGASYDYFNAYLDDDRPEFVNIVNLSSDMFDFKWDEVNGCWQMLSKVTGIRAREDLILASTHEILYENSETFYPSNPGGVIAPEGTVIIDPSVDPAYNSNGVPLVTNFKVKHDGYKQDYQLTWKPVFGEFYVEVRIRMKNTTTQTTPIGVTDIITTHHSFLVYDFRKLYLADDGFLNISLDQLKSSWQQNNVPGVGNKNIYGVDIRLVGKQDSKYYYGNWTCADLTVDPLTDEVNRNIITYEDINGNKLDKETVENIINENANDDFYYGDTDFFQGVDLSNITIDSAMEISTDMVEAMGNMPSLVGKIMTFMPDDIWALIFYGITLVIILRALAR